MIRYINMPSMDADVHWWEFVSMKKSTNNIWCNISTNSIQVPGERPVYSTDSLQYIIQDNRFIISKYTCDTQELCNQRISSTEISALNPVHTVIKEQSNKRIPGFNLSSN